MGNCEDYIHAALSLPCKCGARLVGQLVTASASYAFYETAAFIGKCVPYIGAMMEGTTRRATGRRLDPSTVVSTWIDWSGVPWERDCHTTFGGTVEARPRYN